MQHFFTNRSLFHGSMIRYGPEVRYSGEKLVLVGLMHESPSHSSAFRGGVHGRKNNVVESRKARLSVPPYSSRVDLLIFPPASYYDTLLHKHRRGCRDLRTKVLHQKTGASIGGALFIALDSDRWGMLSDHLLRLDTGSCALLCASPRCTMSCRKPCTW